MDDASHPQLLDLPRTLPSLVSLCSRLRTFFSDANNLHFIRCSDFLDSSQLKGEISSIIAIEPAPRTRS